MFKYLDDRIEEFQRNLCGATIFSAWVFGAAALMYMMSTWSDLNQVEFFSVFGVTISYVQGLVIQ